MLLLNIVDVKGIANDRKERKEEFILDNEMHDTKWNRNKITVTKKSYLSRPEIHSALHC